MGKMNRTKQEYRRNKGNTGYNKAFFKKNNISLTFSEKSVYINNKEQSAIEKEQWETKKLFKIKNRIAKIENKSIKVKGKDSVLCFK